MGWVLWTADQVARDHSVTCSIAACDKALQWAVLLWAVPATVWIKVSNRYLDYKNLRNGGIWI